MSQLRVNTIRRDDGQFSISSSDWYEGTFSKWVEFNGSSTVAERATYGVNNVGDNGVGHYQINFNGAMPNASYVVGGSLIGSTTPGDRSVISTENGVTKSTTSVRINVRRVSSGGTADDADYIGVAIIGT